MAITLNQLIWAAVIGIITWALIAWYQRWLTAKHRKALAAGKPFSFDAFLRGNLSPYPSQFRPGWVSVGYGVPTWMRRRDLFRRRIKLPASAVVEKIRPLSFWENVTLNEDCRVIVASSGALVLELAVLSPEVTTALSALFTSTGNGWRLQAANSRPSQRSTETDE